MNKTKRATALYLAIIMIFSMPLPAIADFSVESDRDPIQVIGNYVDLDFNEDRPTGNSSTLTIDPVFIGSVTTDGVTSNAGIVEHEDYSSSFYLEAISTHAGTYKSAINRTNHLGIQVKLKFNNTTSRRDIFDMKSMNPNNGLPPAWPVLVIFDADGKIKDFRNHVVGEYAADEWYDIVIDLDSPNHQYSFWINGQLMGDKLDLGNWIGPAQSKMVQRCQPGSVPSRTIISSIQVDIIEEPIRLESLSLEQLNDDFYVGDENALQLLKTPENAEDGLDWVSSNENIVAVNQDGVVTGISPGEAVVSVTSMQNPAIGAQLLISVMQRPSLPVPILINPNYVNLDFNVYSPVDNGNTITIDTKLLGTVTIQDGVRMAGIMNEHGTNAFYLKAITESVSTWKSSINKTDRIGIQASVQFNNTTSRRDFLDMKSLNPSDGSAPAWPILVIFDQDGKIKDYKNNVVGEYAVNEWYDIVIDLDSPNRKYSFWINGLLKGDSIDLGNWVGPTQNKIVQRKHATNDPSQMLIASFKAGEIVSPLTDIIPPEALIIEKGKAAHINLHTVPEKAYIKQLTWTSSDTSVARLVDNGLLALEEGDAEITVTEEASGISKTFPVTVVAATEPWESKPIGNEIRYLLHYGMQEQMDYSIEQLNTAEVQTYMNMDEAAFALEIATESSKLIELDTHTKFEEIARKMAQIYRLNEEEAYARRAALILFHLALDYPRLALNDNYEDFKTGENTVPHHSVFAYNFIMESNVWEELSDEWSANEIKQLIEELWFRPSVHEVIQWINSRHMTNIDPYGVRQGLATASILNDPDSIRDFIRIMDKFFTGQYYYADGMWEEGTIDYNNQVARNLGFGIQILKEWADPDRYIDQELGLQLHNTDLSYRWPLLQMTSDMDQRLRYPDGTAVSVHDSYGRTGNPQPLPIRSEALSNVELWNYGYYGLVNGDIQDATHAGLLYQPLLSGFLGGHTHANYLALTLWGAGAEVLPDTGYINRTTYADGSGATLRYPSMRPLFHNMPWIWREDGANETATNEWQKPALLAYDSGESNGKAIQLIEASEPGADGRGSDMNRRLIILVQLDGNRSYTVDLSRLQGGQAHEIYLRGSELEDIAAQTEGIALTDTGAAHLTEYLHSIHSPEGLSIDRERLTSPRAGSGESEFQLTWKGEETGSSIRAFMNGVEGSDVFFTSIPQARRITTKSEEAVYTTPHLTRRRMVDENEITKFGAVYETFRNEQEGMVSTVQWFEPEDGNSMTSIAVVTSDKYKDTIYLSNDAVERSFQGITFAGKIAMVRMNRESGKTVYSYVYGEGKVKTKDKTVIGDQTVVKKITATTTASLNPDLDPSDRANTITVNGKVANKQAFIGKWLQVRFGDGSGYGMKIKKINNAGSDTIITVEQYVPFSLTESGITLNFSPHAVIPGDAYIELNASKFKQCRQ
ncbi:Ig-like domain-containing protein [Paenibacillus sp. J5C_2022]|uniref:Ig-like domain-containing protein n=1 Tax=Paenibacillus sp. J5C2022 TaxID=2977129 RepID=UPI0021CEEF43|nr:Ig-like domain-containing protein [Paenibacillus sp. J5C2022]MCU6709925.1 Ig-like domain-containing protein [Paenibacillus sp. J5C2022]